MTNRIERMVFLMIGMMMLVFGAGFSDFMLGRIIFAVGLTVMFAFLAMVIEAAASK